MIIGGFYIMDNNNTFENKDSSNETPVYENESSGSQQISDSEEKGILYQNQVSVFDDLDIELDPELAEPFEESDVENCVTASTSFAEVDEQPINPIAPIMPRIEKSTYEPIDKSNSGRGIKIFAFIVAFIVLMSACVTGGYYLGISSNNTDTPVIDLASKPAIENALTSSQIYNKVSPSVVGIYVYNNQEGIVSTATGVIYSKDGYIVTNDHIYDGVIAPKFKIYTHDKKMYSADYIAGDTRSDLAVLKITNADNVIFKAAELGNSKEAVVGENVVAIGRPNGATNPSIASEGIISAVSTRVSTTSNYTSSLIQTDSAINPGNSGGALCNVYGQVIGITSAKLVGSEYDGVGYAIPTTTVKKIVESLIKHKTVKGRAKLGISYLHIDQLTAEITKKPCGLQIAAIDQSCDLYGKSVAVNDIITHVNSIELTDANIILDIIEAAAPGDTLQLKIYSVKNKQSLDITVKLLEDIGTSSYTTKKQQQNNKNDTEYNSSEFNFPNGE